MNTYLLRDENAVYYECGFSCDNEIFLKSGEGAWFITDPRYTLEARDAVRDAEVVEAHDLIAALRNILRRHRIRKVWYDPTEWSIHDFRKLSEKSHAYFAPKERLSQHKRIVKSDAEVALLKEAARIGAEAFDRVAAFLRERGEGLDERRLFFEASAILQQEGRYALSFEPILALGANAAKPHAHPTDTLLRRGDLLLFDAGVKVERYCSDRTRTAEFGPSFTFDKAQRFSDATRQKVYDTVLKAQEAAIRAVRPGRLACEIDRAARAVIEEAGYGDAFVHSTGHGVGLDIHELPVIYQKSRTRIEEGMVFTIEPGIYLEGRFGVRIEDMVCVRSDGAEVL